MCTKNPTVLPAQQSLSGRDMGAEEGALLPLMGLLGPHPLTHPKPHLKKESYSSTAQIMRSVYGLQYGTDWEGAMAYLQ